MSATSDPTAAFAEVARRFCGLLDQPLKADELAVAMADLAAAVERLPDVDPGSDAVEVNDVGANDGTRWQLAGSGAFTMAPIGGPTS